MEKDKLHSSIFAKLLLIIALTLIVFVLVMRVMFGAVFFRFTYEKDLKEKSAEAAQRAGVCFAQDGFLTAFIQKDLSVCQPSMDFLRDYAAIDYAEIWVVANETVMISYNADKDALEFDEIPTRYHPMLSRLFSGESVGYADYADIWNRNMFGVASPVMGANGQPIAAVIMQISNQHVLAATKGADTAVIMSSVVAILAAFVLALFMANRLTRPLRQMESVAKHWETEDYAPRTNVKARDEIGRLAAAMDEMAQRLMLLKSQRQQTERERARFFADVSHELKTPVTVLRAQLELLQDDIVTDPEERRQSIADALTETAQLQRLIEDLLTLSKLQSPEFQLENHPVCLCEVLRDIARSNIPLAKERGVTLDFENDCNDRLRCTVMGDYTRIRQMLGILIDNGERYAGKGGAVSVRLGYDDGAVITVSDNGPGMSGEALEHIFDRYYTHYRKSGGSGLGLPICRQIAIRHGATLVMESEPGKGSKATIRFPRSDSPALPDTF